MDHAQHHPRHGHAHRHGRDGQPFEVDADESALAEMLDLDAEVLHAYLSEVTAWVGESTDGGPVGRVLDLGCGTGTGTFALLRRFERADVIAVDASEEMLRRLGERAGRSGVADRVRVVRADLDSAWPGADVGGPLDLVWASASLHHMADPDRVLRDVLGALRPGGSLAVVELEGMPRFLPDDLGLGRPGLEARCHAEAFAHHAVDLPHMGADWGTRLSNAGFTVEAERAFGIEPGHPLPASARRYAQLCLRRMRDGFADRLDADDLAVLDTLVADDGPHSVLHRDDLTVRANRTAWVARRV